MFNKKEIARFIAIFSLRSSRGAGLRSRITNPIKSLLDGSVYIFALRGLGFDIPLSAVYIIIPIFMMVDPFLAWLDEKHLGFWKAENYYSSNELNEFNQQLLSHIVKIEKELNLRK